MAAEIHPRKSEGKGKEKDKGSGKASAKTIAWVKAGKATSMKSVTPIADRVGQIHGHLGIQWTRQNKPQKKTGRRVWSQGKRVQFSDTEQHDIKSMS